MAIYAFDFDEVAKTIKDLDQVAENLEGKLKSCSNNLSDDLSAWSGDANSAYNSQTNDNYNVISQDIDTIKGMSSYLGEVSDVISSAEDSLASLKI